MPDYACHLPRTVLLKEAIMSAGVLWGISDVGVSKVLILHTTGLLALDNNKDLLLVKCLETLWQI